MVEAINPENRAEEEKKQTAVATSNNALFGLIEQ